MKKNILFVLFVFVFGSFVFANEVNNVSVKFCNDGLEEDQMTNKYTAMLEPGSKKDICLFVNNKSKKDLVLKYSFPSSSFSPGGNQVCNPGEEFSKLLLDNPNRTLVVSGESSLVIKETLFAPIGLLGMHYGCLAYQIADATQESAGGMFNFVVRKALHLNMFVGGDATIDNNIQLILITGSIYSSNKNVGVSFNDDGDMILNFAIKNNGNLTQSVSLEGKIWNPLGFEKPFETTAKKLLPGESYNVSVNVGMIPAYKGLFSTRVTLTGTPVFEFDASGIDEKFKQPVVIKETGSLFVFSWIYVILAIVIIGLIVKIVVPKRKKAE